MARGARARAHRRGHRGRARRQPAAASAAATRSASSTRSSSPGASRRETLEAVLGELGARGRAADADRGRRRAAATATPSPRSRPDGVELEYSCGGQPSLLVADRRRVGRPPPRASPSPACRRPPFATAEPLARRRAARRRPAALPAAVAARRRRWRSRRAPAAKGAERLGLHTVGDLLEHLPRDRQAARTIARARDRRDRDGRRRGALDHAPPGAPARDEAARRGRRRRRDRHDEGDVLQPAVARAQATGPGTRLLLQGKYQGRNRFRVAVPRRRPARRSARGGEMATYPATEGLSSTQILALVRERRGARAGGARAAAGAAARARAAARPRRRARRRALRRPRGRPPPARLRGAAAAPDRAAAPARAAPRGRARRARSSRPAS